MQKLLAHQMAGLCGVQEAKEAGHKRILYTGPTGSGKTRTMVETILGGESSLLLTNRRALLGQTSGVLQDHFVPHGLIARGERRNFDLTKSVQLAMTQTFHSRVIARGTVPFPPVDQALIDEIHMQGGGQLAAILEDLDAQGATVIAYTATPLDLGHRFDVLVQAGTNSSLREAGMLIPALHFAPSEPEALVKYESKRFPTDPQIADAHKATLLYGHVVEHWKRHNPARLPTILFAASVGDSRWWAENLPKQGISAAHISAEDILLHGAWLENDEEGHNRKLLFDEVRAGRVDILCNRFVLREGVDLPELYCGILATTFGSLSSYIQACGRLLRAHHTMDHCVILDHGGNWWRFGSINEDRHWELAQTQRVTLGLREEAMRSGREPEPICCRKCYHIRLWGKSCPECGYQWRTPARRVLQADGKLVEVDGKIFKARRQARTTPDEIDAWKSTYYMAKNAGMTFGQAIGFHAKNNHWRWPREDWPLMPRHEIDRFMKVCDVPMEDLL